MLASCRLRHLRHQMDQSPIAFIHIPALSDFIYMCSRNRSSFLPYSPACIATLSFLPVSFHPTIPYRKKETYRVSSDRKPRSQSKKNGERESRTEENREGIKQASDILQEEKRASQEGFRAFRSLRC